MEIKASTILLHTFLIVFFGFSAYTVTHQDCEENPPQVLSCGSTNLIDEKYTDCKISQYEEKNLIFPDKEERYNCAYGNNRIDVPLKKTKCSFSPSNLTTDYRFCS